MTTDDNHDRFRALRVDYTGTELRKDAAADDPVAQFESWFQTAESEGVDLANSMTLATVDGSGMPSTRIVLLKSFDDSGFVFYTNYQSAKAHDLDANPNVALGFWWPQLHRQIGIRGRAQRVSDAQSDEYFASRPRDSNLSAMASPQSQIVSSRADLERRVHELREQVGDGQLSRPAHWGGYCIVPRYFEFWQGRNDRLHDRVVYERQADSQRWSKQRLAP